MDTLEMYRESMAKLMDAVKGSGVTLMEENGEEEINIENVKSKVADIGEAYYGSNGNEYNVADGILTNFLQLENDNYTIFSYVSNLNNEVSFFNANCLFSFLSIILTSLKIIKLTLKKCVLSLFVLLGQLYVAFSEFLFH